MEKVKTKQGRQSETKEKSQKVQTMTKNEAGPGKGSAVTAKVEMTKKNGLRHKIFSADKYSTSEYTGEWKDDKKHGYGTQTWSKSGSSYTGYWKHGKPEGEGTLEVLDPKSKKYVVKYAGEWQNGKKHGMGIYFDSSSAVYEGNFVEGHQNGWGRMYYPNGDVYAGDWLNGQHHGQGVMLYSNKDVYVGEWREGSKNGKGSSHSHSKGLYFEGMWINGSPTSQEQLSEAEFETRNEGIRSCIEVLQMWHPAV